MISERPWGVNRGTAPRVSPVRATHPSGRLTGPVTPGRLRKGDCRPRPPPPDLATPAPPGTARQGRCAAHRRCGAGEQPVAERRTSPGEVGCDYESVLPGEGYGFQGGGGPGGPRLLKDLHPLSATLLCLEDSFQAEGGEGGGGGPGLPRSPQPSAPSGE